VADLQIRAMTQDEFKVYRARVIKEYAQDHVRAGNWREEEAEERAANETDAFLPDGVDTPGMVLLIAEAGGEQVGHVWLGPAPREQSGWWIYDIEVVPAQRRRGYGRVLLEAAEREATRRGGQTIGLNVFGGNDAAQRLYASSGYEVTSVLMRKDLGSEPTS
jgi:ribosomal protein S18 acetylase RimI-like enzyme